MIEQLPGEIVLPTRDMEVERHKRAQRLRLRGIDTGEGTQAHAYAQICADVTTPIYATARVIGDNSVLENARGQALIAWGRREGVGVPRGELPASGFVQLSTSSGGGTVPMNDELVHEASGLIFKAIETKSYTDGKACAIIGKSTGLATNLPAKTKLKWLSPRPGIAAECTVTSGGLTGGRAAENEADYLARIQLEKNNRAASGNDAQYQQTAQNTPSVAVQKAFTYPGILGPSSTCVVFTMRPATPGGSRVPNSIQIGLVEAYTTSELPCDDAALFGALDEEDAEVCYGLQWNEDAPGWTDITTWPPFYERNPAPGSPGAIVILSAASPTEFSVGTQNSDFTNVAQPQVGQTVGLYDAENFRFVAKRILSVTGTGPWDIVVDTTNDVSDITYTPVLDDRLMPWSSSLDSLLSGVLAYFDSLGPGEQQSTFYDEGRRQKRQPRPPRQWPSVVTAKGLSDAIDSELLDDVTVLQGDGLTPSVGSPGVLSNILRLERLAFFPD